jgi:viroplasmin and RNaseH domain-containing protein
MVYRGRRPGVYENWVACHQLVSGFHNCCYKSFNCKSEAIASYPKFTGEADVHAVNVVPHMHAQLAINNTLCLQIIVVVEFLIILGLLVFICCIYK